MWRGGGGQTPRLLRRTDHHRGTATRTKQWVRPKAIFQAVFGAVQIGKPHSPPTVRVHEVLKDDLWRRLDFVTG